jgi:hypothetical protein
MRIVRNVLAVVVLLVAATVVSRPKPVEAWQMSGCSYYQAACQSAAGQFFEAERGLRQRLGRSGLLHAGGL